jgi:hypothetical protein
MAKANPILKELKAAAKGLLFPSETDAPIEAFAWPGGDAPPDEAAVRTNAKVPADKPVEQMTLADLANAIPEESRGDFLPLFGLLGHHLSGTTVFRVGEINIDVYVVGRTTDGQYAGVKTKMVET